MSTDSWDDRRRVQEEQFFAKQNAEALARLKLRQDSSKKERLSPISGKPMEQVTLMGVVIDRCQESGGIWLDNGELEQILEASKQKDSGHGWLSSFIAGLKSK